MSRIHSVVACLAVLFLLGGAATTDAQTTTGRLIGTIRDDGSVAIPGATVTITSPTLIGGPQTRISDGAGEFSFVGIAPGEYSVNVSLHGFVTQERSEVKVNLGGATAIAITLPEGTFGGEVEVVAETPVVDPTQVNTEQIYSESYLQNASVGSRNRDYTSVLVQAAGVAGNDNPNVFGSAFNENAYYIDGIDTTDPVVGMWGTTFNFDSIQEIQFQTSGFEAEYGRATGGLVNLVTKSGGNQFSGTLDIRYRDDRFQEGGEHYDNSELDSAFQDIGATLGGPILRDKVWFFGSYEWINSEFTPISSPTTRDWEGTNYLGKLTWQMNPSWRLMGKYSGNPAEINNDDASRYHEPEATTFQKQGSDILTFELNGVLSNNLMWNTTVGTYSSVLDSYPQSGDLQAIAHTNGTTGMFYGNNANQQYSDRNRDELGTNLTWFVGNLGGSHEIKGGVEYSALDFSSSLCSTGTPNGEACVAGGVGLVFNDTQFDDAPLPWLMWENTAGGEQVYTGDLYTAYLQDAWRVMPNLTLKVGVRYDTVAYDNNLGDQIADMGMWQPRLGVAWDITGDAKNVLRGNFGRFMHPSALVLPWQVRASDEPSSRWYSCSGVLPLVWGAVPTTPGECAAMADAWGYPYRMDPEAFDSLGWVLPPWEHYGDDPNGIDPNTRPTYADTFSIAYEREVGNRASVELAFVDKKTRDVIEDTCDGNIEGDPSPDASCNSYILGNLMDGDIGRDYRGFIVRYESRRYAWLTLLTSYTFSESKGNIEGTQGGNSDFDFYPWHWENRYGYLSDHAAHRFKLNGFFNIKGDWIIGFDGFWSSAFTWEPRESPAENIEIPYGQYFLEERGSRDANSNHQIDLQLTKGFTFNNVRLVLIGSVYNAMSSERGVTVCNSVSGCGTDDDGDPIEMGDNANWQTPRRWEVGFRIEF